MDGQIDVVQRLTDLVMREQVGRVRDRLRAVLLVKRGVHPEEAAASLDRGRDFARRWTARFDRDGHAGLADRPRPGAGRKLDPAREADFLTRLGQPRTASGATKALRGADIAAILSREFGAEYSLKGVYDLLSRLGCSCLAPRPRHPRSPTPEAQEAWKGNAAPLLSSRSARATRAPGSS